MDFYDEYMRADHRSGRRTRKAQAHQRGGEAYHARRFGDFTCRHCGRVVSSAPGQSGVNHRNHCPYCLWSKHVDRYESGDRLAVCQGPMAPVGVSFKHSGKRYAGGQPGELLLVHQCTGCGALSINRLAADDGAGLLWEVFEASLAGQAELAAAAQADGIDLAGPDARALVQARVFGKSAERVG
jgi:hypothetical protein